MPQEAAGVENVRWRHVLDEVQRALRKLKEAVSHPAIRARLDAVRADIAHLTAAADGSTEDQFTEGDELETAVAQFCSEIHQTHTMA